jgi:hypothetical protein
MLHLHPHQLLLQNRVLCYAVCSKQGTGVRAAVNMRYRWGWGWGVLQGCMADWDSTRTWKNILCSRHRRHREFQRSHCKGRRTVPSPSPLHQVPTACVNTGCRAFPACC